MVPWLVERGDKNTYMHTYQDATHAREHPKCRDISRDLIGHFDQCRLLNEKEFEFIITSRNFDNSTSKFMSTVSVDGLALLGVRPSSDTVMTNVRPRIYPGPALQGSI